MPRPGTRWSRLAALVDGAVAGVGDPMITDVTHDSRSAAPGCLFVAIRGAVSDGHEFAQDAVDAGAVAVCVDHATSVPVPQLIVEDTRDVLGTLADSVHGSPSTDLEVIGVTGTNGKTTVTHFIESIAASAGLNVGLVGTIETRLGPIRLPSVRTTPEASDFQRLLAEMRDRDADLVAAEISSHALALSRVKGTRFAVAVFTNLSQDHLDFHGDMTSYRAAKQTLFTDYEVGAAVVNIDDPVGGDIASMFPGKLTTVGSDGHVRVGGLATGGGGSRFRLESPWGSADVSAPVVGEFNVSNLVIAAASCLSVGVSFEDVVAGMCDVGGVPGRFEVVSGEDPVTVIVDYAHTPEGVTKAVATARGLSSGRVIAVLGAGGDRDREKRPAMGAALSRADVPIITSDNPRTEDPESIAAALEAGVGQGVDHIVEIDRRRAIERALQLARPDDVVLVLGRGHEPMQDIGGRLTPFDDRVVAAEILGGLRHSTESGPRSGSMST